jgi:ATP cone domain/Restriction endonuclease
MSHNTIQIRKTTGEKELFDLEKLTNSLRKIDTAPEVIARVVEEVRHDVREGMTTGDIYERTYDYLRQMADHPTAARYSLRRALFQLGPSGFPFELFIAEVLKAHGWVTRTQVVMMGRCVEHEIDILGDKEGRRVGIEAKFHNDPGVVTDVKDALYVYARYEDLRHPRIDTPVQEGWLVTNTRFTKNAVRYGRCVGLGMIGWDYPAHKSLAMLIESAGIHPITCLSTLSPEEKKHILEQGIVVCKSLIQDPETLGRIGIAPSKVGEVLAEARALCATRPHMLDTTHHAVDDVSDDE